MDIDMVTIKDIVNRWDISEELKIEKIKILEKWRDQIDNDTKFNLVLKICNEFQYYSEKLTANTYKQIFEDVRKEYTDFDDFLKSTKFTPLRREKRMESSVDMFSKFVRENKLDANITYVNGPIDYIKEYLEYRNCVEKNVKDQNCRKEILNKQKYILRTNLEGITGIERREKIEEIEEIRAIKKEIIEIDKLKRKNLTEFIARYYHVKHIVIIDDFIGTGESGKKLITSLANELDGEIIDITFHLWVLETSTYGREVMKESADSFGIDLEIRSNKISKNVLEVNTIFSSFEIPMVEKVINSIVKDFNIPENSFSRNHALASFVNAPNNNLALLSNKSDQWEALFLRIKRGPEAKQKTDENLLKELMKSFN